MKYRLEIENIHHKDLTLIEFDSLDDANQYLVNNGYTYIWSEQFKHYWKYNQRIIGTLYKMEE